MSDRIVVMRDGKIEQDGTPREIYEEPKNLFVASFIGEINIFNATVIERLDEQRVRANVEGRECNITVNFAVEKGQKLNVLLRPDFACLGDPRQCASRRIDRLYPRA